MQRSCLPPAVTTKLQPCRPTAVAGSTMRVWKVRAVLWLAAFVGACDRSPDKTTTPASDAACCVIVSNEHSPDRAQTADNSNSSMQSACFLPADYRTTTLPPSSSRKHHARVAGPRCALTNCFCRNLRSITRPHHYHLCLPLLAV